MIAYASLSRNIHNHIVGLLLRASLIVLLCLNVAWAQPVSFQYSQSLMFFKVKVNGGRDLLFLMNTGANTTVIDKQAADRMALNPLRKDSVTGTAGKEPVEIVKTKTIAIGKATVRNLVVTQRDLSKFIKCNGKKIDGILGTDFLKNFAIIIDYRARKATFARAAPLKNKELFIPFKMEGDIPCVEARINDTLSTYLRYNSGASMNAGKDIYVNISPEQWRKLKTVNNNLSVDRYISGTGVGGDVYLQVAAVSGIRLHEVYVKRPYIIIQPREGYFEQDSAIGFFGNNLLEKYRKVTIDFAGNKIVFNNMRKK